MQLKSKSTVALAATVAVGLLPAAGASAANFRGVVVHENIRAHSFVLAGSRGRLTAVHARRLPRVGRTADVTARQLRNGTWVADHVHTGRPSARVRIRGTVTYINPRRGTFVLSARGASLLVHERTSLRHNVRVAASDAGLRDGEVVTVDGNLSGASVDASSIHVTGDESSGINLEGTVQAIDAVARTLTVSADDDDQSGAVVTVEVPSSFDLGAFTTGESVELTVTSNPDGTYTLEQSSDDSSATAADDLDDMQGDDHGAEHANAARECASQEADPGFPAAHGGETFTQFYERNADDANNAFGRCVNLTAHQLEGPSGGDGSEATGSTSAASGAEQSGSDQSVTQGSTSESGSDG
jgi:hypothetical protein